jgi:signal transduction histidine kinase
MVPHRYLTGPPVPSAMFVGAQLRITPGWDHRRRNPPELQQQALMNLMLNGIEAMPDTTGELSIKSQLQEDGDVLISVSDTGEGLPAGNADQIFSAFFTTKSQGTGLGLAITRSIVESHGGRIWATANSGPGTTFQFTLPAREDAVN